MAFIVLSEIEAKEQQEFIDDLSRTVDAFFTAVDRMSRLRRDLADRGEAAVWMPEGSYGYEVAARIADAANVIDGIDTALGPAARLKLAKIRRLRGA